MAFREGRKQIRGAYVRQIEFRAGVFGRGCSEDSGAGCLIGQDALNVLKGYLSRYRSRCATARTRTAE
ncbi:hypothetical protein M0804_006255 [Polistes exclamans]|nr:hypothetical protein M0804_006255 [Polistes exclamans]